MLLSVALFQGFLGLLNAFWPQGSIGVSISFGLFSSSLDSDESPSRSCFLGGRSPPRGAWSYGSAYGTRTRASALRGPCPNRLDERASAESECIVSKHKLKSWRGGGQGNSRTGYCRE